MKTGKPASGYVQSLQLLLRVQELCESRGGRPGLSVLNEPYGFCGRKGTLNHAHALVTVCPLMCQPTSEDMKLYIIIYYTEPKGQRVQANVQCCFKSTETINRDREPRTATSTFTQNLSSSQFNVALRAQSPQYY